MKRVSSIVLTIILAAGLAACFQKKAPPPGVTGRGDSKTATIKNKKINGPNGELVDWSVFGPAKEFEGSPLSTIGRNGLFQVRSFEKNRIAILSNGDVSFSARIKSLMKADTSIRIQALTFKGDESGLYISEIMKYKKAQGLDVRVIVDAFSNLDMQTKRMYFDLQQHGINVEGYEILGLEWVNEISVDKNDPLDGSIDLNKRFHEKMWIIDGETDHGVAIVGGLNIGNEYFRVDPSNPSQYWRDQDVIVKGAVVKDMVTAFDRNYEYFQKIKESRGIANTNRYWEATKGILERLEKWDAKREFLGKFGKVELDYKTEPRLRQRVARMAELSVNPKFEYARSRFFQNRPRFEESYISQAYLKLIRDANQEVLIGNAYFVPTAAFIDAVKDAARRCVKVVILSNSSDTNDIPDITIVGRGYYKELMDVNLEPRVKNCSCEDSGVQIWEWQGRRDGEKNRKQGTFHAKYAVFDRVVSLVGSHNLGPRSEKLNSETAIIYESRPLSERLAHIFYGNDLVFSKRISSAEADEFHTPSKTFYWLRKKFGSLFEEHF